MRRLAAPLACALLAGMLGAQTTSTSQSAASADAGSSASKAHDDSFVIGNDDVLAINVWKEPDISRSIPVRSDGKISLPLVGEVQAAGQTPLKLEQEIASKLKSYISDPEVTVIVQQINSQKFNVLGQVARPGSYPLIANSPTCWTRLRWPAASVISRNRSRSTSCDKMPTEPRPNSRSTTKKSLRARIRRRT